MPDRAWIHDEDLAKGRVRELRSLVRGQAVAAYKGVAPDCAGCSRSVGWLHTYRCYQCGLWLCPACSKEHFPEVSR